jgi:hypothetical protein
MAAHLQRLEGVSWQAMHGHKGNNNWPAPALAAKSDQYNRKDQGLGKNFLSFPSSST